MLMTYRFNALSQRQRQQRARERRAADRDAFENIETELARARQVFPDDRASLHESYAILLEEVDELWDAIKAKGGRDDIEAEALQIAAMAIRLINDTPSVFSKGT